MTEINCPVESCSYSTDSNRGLSIHAGAKHPELEYDFTDKKEFVCPYCEETFEDYESRRKSKDEKRNFCSRKCKDSFEGKDGLDTNCTECGKDIHIPPSQIEEIDGYEQKNYFCNKECESCFKSREWIGEDHPTWDGGKEKTNCEECEKEYKVKKSNLEKSRFCSIKCFNSYQTDDKKEYYCVNCGNLILMKEYNRAQSEEVTCSDDCFKEYLSELRKGKKNPQWNGGRFYYYGPNWREKRTEALKRDSKECQECGMSQDEHYQNYNQDLHIHHKVPRREIIDENNPTVGQFEVANSLDNLVTLCKSCHRKLE
jgi:5-methylcytosine-specific restriction endonuclease McrA